MFKITAHVEHPAEGILQADTICFLTPDFQREN